MNCRSEVLEVSVEGRQVEEAMLAVLHTILLHRSTGKFHYKKEGTYSIGTVGTQDIDCDFIEFTYVRVSSDELDRALRKAVSEFKEALRNSGNDGIGQISLLNSTRRRSLVGHSQMNASHGRFGQSKSTLCHWPLSRNGRSVGKKWERNWEKRSLILWK
ncbi:unnamed protein product [Staurois parvus]|uniref:Autophagy-related protein 101 n=1 Tax=Staurois parvus TaxID=386267 RepID=A0ABN9CMF4_9NEOB|nr:unnamed protein product [Staurois parvus]